MKHALNRTSPKGQAFVGTCFQCGRAGITLEMMAGEDCENVRALTQEQAVIEAIAPKTAERGKQ